MQIAVTSQNRKTVTEHAGKCRKFWIYDIEAGSIVGRQLVELGIDESFHANHDAFPAPLAKINALISGSMGTGLHQRLMQQGVKPVITIEEDPDAAVHGFLNNTLEPVQVGHHDCAGHAHH